MKKLFKYLIVAFVFMLLVILSIWGQSMVAFEDSVRESEWILHLIRPAYVTIFGGGTLDSYTWRKVAHVIEYFVLGIIASLLAVLLVRYLWNWNFGWKNFCVSLLVSEVLCVIVAIVDELLQGLNDRHSQVSDVFLDSVSSLVAIILAILIFAIICKIIKWRKQKKHTLR